jgi:hypothetical protein
MPICHEWDAKDKLWSIAFGALESETYAVCGHCIECGAPLRADGTEGVPYAVVERALIAACFDVHSPTARRLRHEYLDAAAAELAAEAGEVASDG